MMATPAIIPSNRSQENEFAWATVDRSPDARIQTLPNVLIMTECCQVLLNPHATCGPSLYNGILNTW
jgi:hypothetical protein